MPKQKSFAEKRNEYGKLGWTVVILGLLSLAFISDVDGDIRGLGFAAIAACVVTGLIMVVKPLVLTGIIAGTMLVVLGLVDWLMMKDQGMYALLAPAIDVGFALQVFVGVARYAKLEGQNRPDDDLTGHDGDELPVEREGDGDLPQRHDD